MACPLTPGQVGHLTIESLAFGGEGVGRVESFPLFVPDTAPGDVMDVRVTEAQARFGRAEVVQIVTPAPDRTTPACPYFGTCGGCHWQHLSPTAQRAAKTSIVRETLEHLGHLSNPPVRPCYPSPEVWHYRHKADFAVAPAEEGFHLGFHGRDPREVVDIASCPLLHPTLNQLLAAFRELLTEWNVLPDDPRRPEVCATSATGSGNPKSAIRNRGREGEGGGGKRREEERGSRNPQSAIRNPQWEAPPYDPRIGRGLVRGVSLRVAAGTGEATALLVTGRREFPGKREFVARWRERCPALVGVAHHARTRASQSPTGRAVGEILGRSLWERIEDLHFQVSPTSFLQVNPALIPPLWETVEEGLRLTGREVVLDAYSGVGTLALRLARSARQVIGIEQDSGAVRDARASARRNNIHPFEALREPAETALPRLAAVGQACDALVLDPPRRGCDPRVLRAALALRPPRIVYVSCDPATLARDLHTLTEGGYTLQFVQPFDFFPQTYHVECVAALALKT
jgi:23S rRNA (uracil1939-C5)-methyltransferase